MGTPSPWGWKKLKARCRGECESCHRRQGETRVLAFHPGMPILCDGCFPLRKERVLYNVRAASQGLRPLITAHIDEEAADEPPETRQDREGVFGATTRRLQPAERLELGLSTR